MQHELRAHSVLAIEKSADLHLRARLHAREPCGRFTERDTRHFALHLPLESRFHLQRLVGKLELQERQPGGRMAKRFHLGDVAGQ